MSYYKPAMNVFEDGILVIPSTQQTTIGSQQFFSYVDSNTVTNIKSDGSQFVMTQGSKVTVNKIDNYKDFKKWLVPDLKSFAKTLGHEDPSKLKKKDLVTFVEEHVRFE